MICLLVQFRNELFSLRIFFLYSLSPPVLTAELPLLMLLERADAKAGALTAAEGANENAAGVVVAVTVGLV